MQAADFQDSRLFGRRLEGAKDPLERDELLAAALPLWFEQRRRGNGEALPQAAIDIFDRVCQLIDAHEEQLADLVLSRPLDAVFLTSRRHYLHKHIQTLVSLGMDARLRIGPDGSLLFHTGERVAALRLEAMRDRELVYDLDFFQIHRRHHGLPTTNLRPNFQFEGDGYFYVCVMTDCPEKATTLLNHHCWLRLIDREGHVISVGKYPMEIDAPFFLAKEAALYSNADRYEWLGSPAKREHKIRISRREYFRLKADIEADIQAAASCSIQGEPGEDTQRDFSFFDHNCTDWALDKVSWIVSIKRDEIRKSHFSVVLPKVYRYVVEHTPLPVRNLLKLFRTSLMFGINSIGIVVALALGGWRRNRANPSSRPLLLKFCELFFHTDITRVTLPFFAREWLDDNLEQVLCERKGMPRR